jgi:hypothetical protein
LDFWFRDLVVQGVTNLDDCSPVEDRMVETENARNHTKLSLACIRWFSSMSGCPVSVQSFDRAGDRLGSGVEGLRV